MFRAAKIGFHVTKHSVYVSNIYNILVYSI